METAIIGLLGLLVVAMTGLALVVGKVQSGQESMKELFGKEILDVKKDVQECKNLIDAFLRANGCKKD